MTDYEFSKITHQSSNYKHFNFNSKNKTLLLLFT